MYLAFQANVISASQTKILEYQTKILEYQTKLMEVNLHPNFEIQLVNVADPIEKIAYEERAFIYNNGNDIDLVNIKVLTYLDIKAICLDKSFLDKVFITDYFSAMGVESNKVGLLRTISGIENKNNLRIVEDETSRKLKEKYVDSVITFRKYHVAEISYFDSLGNSISEFYQFDGLSQYKIDNEIGKKIFEEYNVEFNENRILMLEYNGGMKLIDIINNELK